MAAAHCCDGRPFLVIYCAVLAYFSVAFMGIALLPANLMDIALRDNPDMTKDEIAVVVSTQMGTCSLVNGILSVAVAGWAGRLSDRFGRRRCAALPALGQAVGVALLSLSARLELSWHFVLLGWAITGSLGGPFVFLAASFAYIADWTKAARRGRAFAGVEGLMLYISAVGPLVAGLLIKTTGFAGIWGLCSALYATAAVVVGVVAPPSPQPPPQPAPCISWLQASTPVLVGRLMLGSEREVKLLAVAFLLVLIGVNGGLQAFVLYSQRYLGWQEARLGEYVALFSAIAATLILAATAVLPRLLRYFGRAMYVASRTSPPCTRPPEPQAPHAHYARVPRPHRIADLHMVRCCTVGPVIYLLLIALLPSPAHIAFYAMPLLGLNACALPFFRACFSKARPLDRQGETLMLVAALESVAQMVAAPLAALGFALLLHAPRLVFIFGAGLVVVAMFVLAFIRESALRRTEPLGQLLSEEGESPCRSTDVPNADCAVPAVDPIVPSAR